MIESLTQLTMTQFIDLLCGEVSVLNPTDADKNRVNKVRERIIFDYTKLSDPAAALRILNKRMQMIKHKSKLQIFKMCHNLIELRDYDKVRDIFTRYGLRSSAYTDEALGIEVDSMIKRIERDIAVEDVTEEETKDKSPDEIRQSYDRQCASLMTYFKFQIDLNTIKASQFACMIDQATREIKAKQAVLSKKR